MIEADTYVVRIYRRGPGKGRVSGVVEIVRSRREVAFSSLAALRRILGIAVPQPKRGRG